jgi:hypothetical protein
VAVYFPAGAANRKSVGESTPASRAWDATTRLPCIRRMTTRWVTVLKGGPHTATRPATMPSDVVEVGLGGAELGDAPPVQPATEVMTSTETVRVAVRAVTPFSLGREKRSDNLRHRTVTVLHRLDDTCRTPSAQRRICTTCSSRTGAGGGPGWES